jgi:hypothetical protein
LEIPQVETNHHQETQHNGPFQVEVSDLSLSFKAFTLHDKTPTGAQLASAAGFKPSQNAVVLQFLENGELEDIRPEEVASLQHSRKFIIVESDRSFRLTVDGVRFDWPCQSITGAVLRRLGEIPDGKQLLQQMTDEADRIIDRHQWVSLDGEGVESFISRAQRWELNVQGVLLTFNKPTVGVREAITKAGFNPEEGWQIFLKVKDEPKRAMGLDDVIDLTKDGVEKLRLSPKEVINGEVAVQPQRSFALLDVDEAHLDGLGCKWETVVSDGRRWLLIHDYQLPVGFNRSSTRLALDIPPSYPGAEIDMFYFNPPLDLASGGGIPSTHITATINGTVYQGWSRHRGPQSPWKPATDNVITHLGLVEGALHKEVGQ